MFRVISYNVPPFKFIFGLVRRNIKKHRMDLKSTIKKSRTSKEDALLLSTYFPKNKMANTYKNRKFETILQFLKLLHSSVFKRNFLKNLWLDSMAVKACKLFVKSYVYNIENRLKMNKFIGPFRSNYRMKVKTVKELHKSFLNNTTDVHFHLLMSTNTGFKYFFDAIKV